MKTKLLKNIRKHYNIVYLETGIGEWFAFPTVEYALNKKYKDFTSIRLISIIRLIVHKLYSKRKSRLILK